MAGSSPVHILIVDDEPEVRALLRSGLEPEGFDVSEATDGASLMAHLEKRPVDLVTLDVRLAGEDGFTLAREVRAKHNVPIVMISGKGDMIDRVVGLELGADDYIAKPFHMREVLARIRAVLRRYARPASEPTHAGQPSEASQRYAFDGWALDMGRRELKSPDGAPCELTTAEFNLLTVLIERPGRVLSRDELMDLLKGHDWTPLDRSIDGLVARLRKKIEHSNETPQLVKTVRGVGYVFAGQVRRLRRSRCPVPPAGQWRAPAGCKACAGSQTRSCTVRPPLDRTYSRRQQNLDARLVLAHPAPQLDARHAATETDVAENERDLRLPLQDAASRGGVLRLEHDIAQTFHALERDLAHLRLILDDQHDLTVLRQRHARRALAADLHVRSYLARQIEGHHPCPRPTRSQS